MKSWNNINLQMIFFFFSSKPVHIYLFSNTETCLTLFCFVVLQTVLNNCLKALYAIMLFFSPPHDRKFVITKDNVALMYHAPGKKREFNAFVLDKTYYGPYDETTCIDWTDDSK